MTKPSEAAAAAGIFPSMSEEQRLRSTADLMERRNLAERIIKIHTAALREENKRLEQQLAASGEEIDLLQEVDAAATSVCVGISKEKLPEGVYKRFVDSLFAYDLWRDQLTEATNPEGA